MRSIPKYSLLLLITFFGVNSWAQDRAEQIKQYKVAARLLKEVASDIKNGDLVKGEKLYLQAFETYPVYYQVNDLPKAMITQGNIKGANRLWEAALKSFQKYPNTVMLAGYSDVLISFTNASTSSIINNIRGTRAIANMEFGNVKLAFDEYRIYSEYLKDNDRLLTMALYATQAGDFGAANGYIQQMKDLYKGKTNMHLSKQLQPVYAEAMLHLFKQEYEEALVLGERLIVEDKGINTTWRGYGNMIKAEAHANLGNATAARAAYELVVKRSEFYLKSNNVQYLNGIVALAEKNYPLAISALTGELRYKYLHNLSFPDIIRKSLYYTKRAEAYAGMEDFVKARSDFEAALLYDADFEQAIQGLVRLEGKVISDRKSDKAGPKILITEPALARGLKITTVSGDEVMIKGTASDPSGLKMVFINGKSVYAREDGVFWGTVAVNDGLTKITVSAIDLGDNRSEYTFDIQRAQRDDPGSDIVPVEVKEARNYALIIAAQNYDDSSIPSLENPVSDGIKLKLILKNSYNFDESNILTLFNPDKNDFKKKFLEVMEILQPDDNLVVFYAGHGIWVEKEKKGYWLLTDAKRNDVNSWLANKDVLDLIAKVPSRHTLLITDACFSGSLFKTRSIGAGAPASIRAMNEKISRVAITSGNDSEVPDESVFMKYLVKALSENKEKYLTAQKMFITQILEAVMTESKTEPRYGTLELAGHVGGDFIFTKK